MLRPPMERDAPITKKYGYSVQFDKEPFSGTTTNLPKAQRRTQQRKKKRVGKSLSLMRKNWPGNVQKDKENCVKGGPNMEFLRRHMLDEHSHPMDCFNALMPLTPRDNIEDVTAANVKGDR
mmetsp:Transcript_34408/g.74376  ORF Transcript_34408/g.74376 Transcript_34408/m.74376 type:complete len:121 (-) Transcript_34408:1533-1895(-)